MYAVQSNLSWTCPAPPVSESTFVGYWYSTPSGGQCADEDRNFGAHNCTWSRDPQQTFTKGHVLAQAGFNESMDLSDGEMLQNEGVMKGVFDAQWSRCCGC